MGLTQPATIPAVGLSLSAFARQIGVDRGKITKAIRSGRLQSGVGYNARGKPVIVDERLAREEFRAKRDPAKDREAAQRQHGTPAWLKGSFFEDRQRLIRAQTAKIKLQLRERRHQLVNLRAVEVRFATRAIIVRDHLLALPSKMRLRMPHLTDADLVVIDEILRDALQGLATEAKEEDS